MTTTTPTPDKVSIREKDAPALGQLAAIISLLAGLAGLIGGIIWAAIILINKLGYDSSYKTPDMVDPGWGGIGTAGLIVIIGGFLLGFVNYQQPNTASVYTFFGNYVGTVTRTGLFVVPIPFVGRQSLSQAQSNFESATLKINDQRGNPLSVSAVVVYRVDKPAQATFAVDNYIKYLNVQVESALRHAVAQYPYQTSDENAPSLLSHADDVNHALTEFIAEAVTVAGIEVVEARINNLSYSNEIAAAMLQKQQAEAVVEARAVIVAGSIGIVNSAIEELGSDLPLSATEKAKLVTNLLTVLVGDKNAQPVIEL